MKVKTYKEALEKAFQIEETRDYSLKKVKKAINLLNNPLKNMNVIHIAGTNGKGSTCKMVFSILKNFGKKVGVFTSPHLLDLKERFLTDIGEITEEEFLEILNKILKLDLKFSFFEKCFLISVLLFEKREVKYAIFEVGLGGLLDSTNIVSPIITAITSIGLDHTKILGNTLEEISYQKAGIIKEGIPIVYNHKNDIIEKIAKEKNSEIIFSEKKVKTNLIGEHQEKNSVIAYEICKYLKIPEKEIFSGLQKVEHFGRLQYITSNLLIDGAHNEDGLLELKKYLDNLNKNNIKLCFSLKKGKSAEKILKIFGKNNYFLIESDNKLMMEKADNISKKYEIKTPEEIYKLSQNNKNYLYVVFGSLYIIGEFLNFK